jgi:hypothetical protein
LDVRYIYIPTTMDPWNAVTMKKNSRMAKVTEIKRKPPIWSVKAGARYVTSFMGNEARKHAIAYAAKNFVEFEL